VKVNYTLPGHQPEVDVGKDLVESFDAPFKSRLQAFERRQPVAWRELLGLNRTPPDPSQVPPLPDSGQMADAAALRQQWRELVSRHGGFSEWQSSPEPVRRMMTLLESYQKQADQLFSRGLSGGED
jgi:hypothetical protein